MAEDEKLFYDGTTKTYFYSSEEVIMKFVKDIFDEAGYFYDPSCKYVDLIRELQSRLGIPEISEDSQLYAIYEAFSEPMLHVKFYPWTLPAGTEVVVITYL